MPELAREWLYFGASVLGAVLLILLLRWTVLPAIRVVARRSETDVDDELIDLLSLPIYLALILGGLYIGALRLSALGAHLEEVGKYATVAATVLAFFALVRVLNWLLIRYARAAEERERQQVVPYVGMVRKAINLVLLALLLMLVLGQLDYDITPLLASLGVAGLAVALALQDSLGNLFAGFYMLFDRPLKVGDYVQLESGDEGFVEEIGWRNTKIRPWANNIIVIPNSKLSQSVLVNHHLPEQRQNVYIRCGVAYESDLEHVEAVCKEVGTEVMQRIEGSDTEWDPVVRYKEFGDSNIDFLLVLRIKEFGAQYALTHEAIKALHRRFNEEGIEISWPMRKLVAEQPLPLTLRGAQAGLAGPP